MRKLAHCSAALAAVLIFAAGPAEAQSIIRDRSSHRRPVDLSLLGGVPYPFGFGVGMRVGLPIAHDGFIRTINDAVLIELGAQFVYWDDFKDHLVGFQVPVLMRWDFFLTRSWTIFGGVGLVFGFYDEGKKRFRLRGEDLFRPGSRPGFLRFAIGGGAMWNFSAATSLRLDATTQMIAVGVVFRL